MGFFFRDEYQQPRYQQDDTFQLIANIIITYALIEILFVRKTRWGRTAHEWLDSFFGRLFERYEWANVKIDRVTDEFEQAYSTVYHGVAQFEREAAATTAVTRIERTTTMTITPRRLDNSPQPSSSKLKEIVAVVRQRYHNSSWRFRLIFSTQKQRENESPDEYARELNMLARAAFPELSNNNRPALEMLVQKQFVKGLREKKLREHLSRMSQSQASLKQMLVECQRYAQRNIIRSAIHDLHYRLIRLNNWFKMAFI